MPGSSRAGSGVSAIARTSTGSPAWRIIGVSGTIEVRSGGRLLSPAATGAATLPADRRRGGFRAGAFLCPARLAVDPRVLRAGRAARFCICVAFAGRRAPRSTAARPPRADALLERARLAAVPRRALRRTRPSRLCVAFAGRRAARRAFTSRLRSFARRLRSLTSRFLSFAAFRSLFSSFLRSLSSFAPMDPPSSRHLDLAAVS